MKKAILVVLTFSFLFTPSLAEARTSYRAPRMRAPGVVPIAPVQRVSGHLTNTGKFIAPYYRTVPDGRKYNNFSTKGNLNPYTGKRGTK